MIESNCKILVKGVTNAGKKFRPSDWAERLSESVCWVGADHRIHYSPYVEPVLIEGNAAIRIDPKLRDANPKAFKQIMDFIRDNNLSVVENCSVSDLQADEIPGPQAVNG